MKKSIFTLLLLSMVNGQWSMVNAQVSEFRPGIVADGVNYALPRTGVRADVTVRKITYTSGEFARYAERYLHMKDVNPEAQTYYEIDRINIYQYGEPDTLKYYTVKLKDKTVAPLVQLTDAGLMVAINTNVPLNTPEVPKPTSTHNQLNGHQYFTSEILAAASSSKMAELVAQEIMDIRESKNSIRRGQVESMPKDGASMRIVLGELDQQEAALLQLFTGWRDTTTTTESYSIMPDGDIQKAVFFRFSTKLGLLDDDDVAGMPYYISIRDQHTVPLPTEAEMKKRRINGIVYNMASVADVKIFSAEATIYDKELPFPQFGTIDVLAPTLFGKDATTSVIFNHATGTIQQINK
ncbi:MAG: DUF4831 family protein [Bacteroidaceae bacterium]|nr:DUF4831 family protein [Bacteroidaceae bacterium]